MLGHHLKLFFPFSLECRNRTSKQALVLKTNEYIILTSTAYVQELQVYGLACYSIPLSTPQHVRTVLIGTINSLSAPSAKKECKTICTGTLLYMYLNALERGHTMSYKFMYFRLQEVLRHFIYVQCTVLLFIRL